MTIKSLIVNVDYKDFNGILENETEANLDVIGDKTLVQEHVEKEVKKNYPHLQYSSKYHDHDGVFFWFTDRR